METWKPIPGYAGYEASDRGRIRSYHTRNGRAWHIGTRPARFLSVCRSDRGYGSVNVMTDDGEKDHKRVPELVMLAFVGPCPEGLEICHYDGDPSNNNIENLRYDTRESNIEDKKRHTVQKRGPSIRAIRRRYAAGERAADIAADFGYSEDYIRSIANGTALAYIGGPITNGFRRLKVSHEQRDEIKAYYDTGDYTLKELGGLYGVHESHVSRIINGKTAASNR